MAKSNERLTDLKVRKLSKPGAYPDGRGLYLQVRQSGVKDWFYRYETAGKGHKKGLGPYPTVSLSDARDAAHECRILRRQGYDPIQYFRNLAKSKALEDASTKTFKECAESYIATHESGWSNAKHRRQWSQSLKTYVFPTIGESPVRDVDLEVVVKLLDSIWHTKTETATRVRQRIEAILDWSAVRGYRSGENPARWKGYLDKLLPPPRKVQIVRHQPAMPYKDVPAFFRSIRTEQSVSRLALAFIILTGVRGKEARFAKWDEFDLQDRVWTIPAENMKSRKEHRVPITDETKRILDEASIFRCDDFVFPGGRRGQGISDSAVRKQLKAKYPEYTVHGFRSSFRDWCAEMTNFSRELAEKALGHVVKDKTEAAYQRGDLFEKRRRLMDSWTEFCLSPVPTNAVTPLNRKRA